MTTTVRSGLCLAAIIILSLPVCAAQQGATTQAAPVPTQIAAAKKVFISNAGGEELDPRDFFLPTVDANQAYAEFFAAVKNGGRYEPVLAPADADLIFEIRFMDRLVHGEPELRGFSSDPHLRLLILDPKTNALLWALSRRVEESSGPHFKEKREKNFEQAMAALVGDITILGTQPSAISGVGNK